MNTIAQDLLVLLTNQPRQAATQAAQHFLQDNGWLVLTPSEHEHFGEPEDYMTNAEREAWMNGPDPVVKCPHGLVDGDGCPLCEGCPF